MTVSDRYLRQRILAEIGDAGQERIERSTASISGRDGATTELLYLERAGVSKVTVSPGAPAEPFPHAGAFHFEVARSVGAGAWRALRKIRDTLEIDDA